jgi:signal transduction histidine kinase
MSDSDREESPDIDEEYLEKKIIEKMGHISSELAHDLRSPLQTIQNAIYLLERNPDNMQLFVMVRQSLTQATEILDTFRDYYKAHILQRIEVDPVKVVDLAFSDLEISANITVIRETGEVNPISIDPSKMALAIRKLLLNALDAMPDGGELRVSITEENETVKIVISDTGVGVSPEISEIIYTPFLTGQKKGRGLGVPTAKRVVESHGGSMSYESIEGEGTHFNINLPRPTVNL